MKEQLSIRQLRYEFSYPGEIHLHHGVPTITFRGAFGYALAQVIAREAHIPEFRSQLDLYRKIFTPDNDGTENSRNYDLARPFILRGWYSRPDRRSFILDVHLFGCAGEYESFFDKVIEVISFMGIGSRNQVCHLEKLLSRPIIPASMELTKTLKVHYLTPCSRLKSGGEIFYDQIPFYAMFARLADRLLELDHLYGSGTVFTEEESFRLKKLSREISWERQSGGCYHTERRSGRTRQTMRLDGFQGEMLYRGDFTELDAYLRYLPYINLGRFNVFGCGWCEMKYIPGDY